MAELDPVPWTVTNDDGTGQVGTVWNNAWTQAAMESINDLLNSATNPTVTPADIIDEVVEARGNEASLDDRISGVIDDDGNLIVTGGLITESDLEAVVGAVNVASNGDMAGWALGAALAPDDFVLTGAGATIVRTGIGEADTTHFGTGSGYAAKVTRAGADTALTLPIVSGADLTKNSSIKSDVFSGRVKAKTAVAGFLRLLVDDGVLTTVGTVLNGGMHTGGNTEEELSITHTISAAATKLELAIQFVGSNGDGYVGGLQGFFSPTPPPDWKPLSPQGYASAGNAGLVKPGDQSFGSVGTKHLGKTPTFYQGSQTTSLARGKGTLHTNVTPVGNTGAGPDALMPVYTLKGGSLDAIGRGVRITARFKSSATAKAKTITFVYGGTSVTLIAAAADNNVRYKVVIEIHYLTATTQFLSIISMKTGNVIDVNTTESAAETMANDSTIGFTATIGGAPAANDIVQTQMIVETI